MSVRVINRHEMASLLSMRECIDLMRQAFVQVAEGRVDQPVRAGLPLHGGENVLSLMPGHLQEPACFGVKAVSVFPGNHGTTFGSHQGAVLLFDDRTGALKAVLDGRDLTSWRTGAASAAATDVLARADSRSLTIFGYGEEAVTHARAMTLVRDFETITVCGRSIVKAQAFADRMSAEMGRPIHASSDAQASARSDVICTVTAAAEPFLMGRFIAPGTHVNAVGSSIPEAAEIDDDLVRMARFFGDYVRSTLALGGEIRGAIARGVVGPAHVLGGVGDVITGRVEGRRSPDDITVFKSLGMIAEDLVVAAFLLDRAEARDVGTLIDW